MINGEQVPVTKRTQKGTQKRNGSVGGTTYKLPLTEDAG